MELSNMETSNLNELISQSLKNRYADKFISEEQQYDFTNYTIDKSVLIDALDFLKTRYLNFYNNCKELQIKYGFEIKLYPYSIGVVKFQNLLIDFNTIPPSEIIQDVMNYTFVSRKSWINRFFK